MQLVQVGSVWVGDGSLALIAGPCVIESRELCQQVAGTLRELCARLEMPYIFSGSRVCS
jgi:2-dehydro-3-deoxyphosphooctonate aldolase (KDO 8-P synthase)